ncbi:MAG: hypothetical protein Tsb0017_22530 [Geothermobacteraceae bacterium]
MRFDPRRLSYRHLLAVFWQSHNPEAKPYLRQYRNVVFTVNEEQRREAEAFRDAWQRSTGKQAQTAIEPAGTFTPAEDYHQKYYLRRVDSLWYALKRLYPDEQALVASSLAARFNGYLGCYAEPGSLEKDVDLLGLSPEGKSELLETLRLQCRQFIPPACALPPTR